MLRILGPAVAGAVMQLAAVMLLTAASYFLAQHEYLKPPWPFTLCQAGTSCHSATLLVRSSLLLTAVGISLTDNHFITRTTRWARYLSRATRWEKNRFSAEAVTVLLSIAVIGSVIEELGTPSEIVVAIGRWIGDGWMEAILWPALWSIAIAGLGTFIHSTARAIPR
jgi:hypothetical protein